MVKKLPLLEHLEIDPIIPEIDPKEKEVIELIEKEKKRPLPAVMEIKERKLGYIVKNKHVIGLSINLEYGNKLSGLPEWIHLYYDDELPPDVVLTQMSSLQRKLFTTLDLKRFIKK